MRFALTAACLLALAGCGGSEGPKRGDKVTLNDNQKLAALVTEFADTSDVKNMTKYFTAGQKITPTEFKKYLAHSYQLDGKPTMNGDQATGNVKITTNDGKDVGTKEWSFAKEGDNWKIKSAPMP